jgi:hypothetical protein
MGWASTLVAEAEASMNKLLAVILVVGVLIFRLLVTASQLNSPDNPRSAGKVAEAVATLAI